MSRIEELIAELAPDGVKYRALASLGRRNSGTAMTASKMKTIRSENGPVRIFAGGHTIADVAEDAVPAKDIIRDPSIIVKSRGHIGFAFYERPFTHKAELWSYTLTDPSIDQKFVYYYLLTKVDELQDLARATSVKLPQLGVRDTDTLRIPVPPLEVQREIVRILDQFTQLEAELEAELEARRRQYSYYRDELLISSVDAQRTPLGEIADFRYGFTASAQDSGDCRFIRITDISPWGKLNPTGAKYVESSVASDEYLVERGDLLMARTGATYGKTMIVESDEPAVYASFLIRIRPDPEVLNPSFYWHFAQSTLYWDQVNAMVSTGGQPQFNANVLKLVKVPLPSLDEQQRVVAVLDRFDALVNNLSVGLPAELAARRKQYEYYRDKLLTFKELAA